MSIKFTDSLATWESKVSAYQTSTSGYGTSSTTLGGGEILYPSANPDTIGDGWATWSNGYTGQVLNVPGAESVTIDVNGLSSFGFYVEPDQFQTESITVTLSNKNSLTEQVAGEGGAQFFGFYDIDNIKSITITDNSGDDFAFGEFYFSTSTTPTYADEDPNGGTAYFTYDRADGGTLLYTNTGGSLSWRNNNPGNILYVGQSSAIGSYYSAPNDLTYCVFDTYADGVQAAVAQLDSSSLYAGLSVNQALQTWTGLKAGKKLTNYESVVDAALGLPGTTALSSLSAPQLDVLVIDGIQRAEGYVVGKQTPATPSPDYLIQAMASLPLSQGSESNSSNAITSPQVAHFTSPSMAVAIPNRPLS